MEVGGGVGVDGVAAAQEVEQGTLDGQEEDGERERDAQKEAEAVVDGVLSGGLVPASHGDAEDGGAADADEGGEGGDRGEGGGADAYGGQGEGAVGGDVAHEDTVYHAVQNIEKLRPWSYLLEWIVCVGFHEIKRDHREYDQCNDCCNELYLFFIFHLFHFITSNFSNSSSATKFCKKNVPKCFSVTTTRYILAHLFFN